MDRSGQPEVGDTRLLEKCKGEILREPRGGWRFWLILILGCLLFCVNLVLLLSPSLGFSSVYRDIGGTLVGLAFILWSVSELLPADRRRLRIVLRSAAVALLPVILVLIPLAFAADFL